MPAEYSMQFEPLCRPIRLRASRYFYLPPPPTPGTRQLKNSPPRDKKGQLCPVGCPGGGGGGMVTARIEPCINAHSDLVLSGNRPITVSVTAIDFFYFSLCLKLKWDCRLKAGFHWRRTQSRCWSRKNAFDLMKIENRSRKRSHKLDGIGVGRIRTVPFSSGYAYDSDAYDPVKSG